MDGFSPEVQKILKYYVYRLIDPRTGHTFYIGKGKGNRVFAHVNNALSSYQGEGFLDEDDRVSAKIQQIIDIKNAGLDVVHIIQRWGMENDVAYEVESALIDCFHSTTNLQRGHNSDYGAMNAFTLQRDLSIKAYSEPSDVDYMIIKTSQNRVDYCNGDIYEATRYAWKLNYSRAIKYKYILSVINGVVMAVYEPEKWQEAKDNHGRYEFFGKPAPQAISSIFVNKRVPEEYVKKGMSNPILYKKEITK